MTWLEYFGTHRPVLSVWWLGTVLLVRRWCISMPEVLGSTWRSAASPRMPRLSREWLRKHEADSAKHDDSL